MRCILQTVWLSLHTVSLNLTVLILPLRKDYTICIFSLNLTAFSTFFFKPSIFIKVIIMPFLRRFACCVSYTEPIQIPLLKLQNARQTRSLPIFSTFSQYAFAGVLGPYALVLYSADCSEIFAWLCLSWLVSSCP